MSWRAHIARYGPMRFPGEPWVRWTFLALLVLAAVLRFWDLPHLPYTHDELSALIRIHPTLGETIQKGVIELDTHPPGVQVFEWLWTRVFTMNEADVKLPFMIMGLLALFLLYRFALAWTSAGPALLLTTLMAATQYSVLYAQIARPYAAGLFTMALLADQLTRHLAFRDRRTLAGVGIAAVLSAYTHHFALMLAALMVGTGLVLMERDQRKAYAVMCALVVALYLPNLSIFLTQLAQGGLTEWLQPPGPDWLPRYAWFIANDSKALAALLVIWVSASVALLFRYGRLPSPARWFLPLWGALPLVVGYAYSVWRAPVLQYSMLLFSFPYLVLFLSQGLVHLRQQAVVIACAVTAFVSVRSLVNDRLHYALFYRSKYEAMVRAGVNAVKENGKEGTLVLLDAPDNVVRFYYDHWQIHPDEFPYVQLRERFNTGQLDSLLHHTGASTVVYGQSNGAPPEQITLVQQRFPYLVERQDLLDGQVFRFSRTPVAVRWFDRDTIAWVSPAGMKGNWRIGDDVPRLRNDSGSIIGWDYAGREFGVAIDLPLDSIVYGPSDEVEVIATVDGWDPASEARIIADLRSGDSTIYYRGGDLHPASRPPGPAAMAVTVSPSDFKGGPAVLRTYVYNPTKAALRVLRIDMMRREGNPVRYGTLEPVTWRGRFPAE